MSRTDETHIILRARAGERGAFDELYRMYFPMIYATVARRMQDPDETEDLVQTAFLRAFQGLDTFRGEAAFSTWLTQIALNVCNSHYQASRARQRWVEQASRFGSGFSPSRSEDPEEALCRKERRELVRRHILRLPANCREAMWLRYVKDYSYAEIGAELRVPMGTVKTWLWRGRLLVALQLYEGLRTDWQRN